MLMRTVIVYESLHHENTRRVAGAMAGACGADLLRLGGRQAPDLLGYDLVGLGSGIYHSRHHPDLLEFARNAPFAEGARVFLFSTAGLPSLSGLWHRPLRAAFGARGIPIAGELCLPGYDTYAIFGLVGGINRGRPGEKELERARGFARAVVFGQGAGALS
jgi:flavodoxin